MRFILTYIQKDSPRTMSTRAGFHTKLFINNQVGAANGQYQDTNTQAN